MSTKIQKALSLFESFNWKPIPNTEKLGYSVESTIEVITPDHADLLLTIMAKNRPVKNQNVAKIAKDITSGKYYYNGECLSFDEDRNLINGQHRLKAIIKSGIAVPLEFKRGLIRDLAYWTMDGGSKRSTSDRLKDKGFENVIACASFVRTLWAYSNKIDNINNRHCPYSDETIYEVLLDHPDFSHSYKQIQSWGTTSEGYSYSNRGTQFVHYMLTKNYPEEAATFFDLLINGYATLDPKHPVAVLRKCYGQFRGEEKIGKGIKDNAYAPVTAAMMIKTFRLYQDKVVKCDAGDLKWTYGVDEFPDIGDIGKPLP